MIFSNLGEVAGVSVSFGETKVVSDVSFSVGERECLTIIGPNGAGKSTIARVLSGLITPSAGRASVRGLDVRQCTPWQRAQLIAYVPQRVSHLPAFAVRTFLEMSMYRFLQRGSNARRNSVDHYLEQWALEHIATRSLNDLSGGELQRVLLAGAAAQEPDILVLDEPTTFLDVTAREQVLDRLQAWRDTEGKSLLIVTHDLIVMDRLSDRVIGMKKGKLCGEQSAQSAALLPLLSEVFDRRFIRVQLDEEGRKFVVTVPQ